MAQFINSGKEWKRIADDIPCFIFIVNLEHEIIYMNKQMSNHFDQNPHSVVGNKCFGCIHGSDCTIDNCLQKKIIKDMKPHIIEINENILGGYVEITAFPYYDSMGKLDGTVHMVRSINDRISFRKERDDLQFRLLNAQKLESVGQLASGIAHEINTPTQFITSNINFLNDAFKEIADVINPLFEIYERAKYGTLTRECLDNNTNSIESFDWEYFREEVPVAINQSKDGLHRVFSIVQAMKSFSHPGGYTKTEEDINRIIKTTITVSRNEWKYVSVVETDLDPNLRPVPCLSSEISQVILNLLINAAHAIETKIGRTPEGIKGSIKVSTKQHDDTVEIKISDTGTGIPEKVQKKIFDPFFTTKEVGKGSGQGLAIAHDVIFVKHGGSISFDTEPEVGTTFTILLPLASTHRE